MRPKYRMTVAAPKARYLGWKKRVAKHAEHDVSPRRPTE